MSAPTKREVILAIAVVVLVVMYVIWRRTTPSSSEGTSPTIAPAPTPASTPGNTRASSASTSDGTASASFSNAISAGKSGRASTQPRSLFGQTSALDGGALIEPQATTFSAVGLESSDLPPRQAAAFTINHDLNKFRRNLVLNANAKFPPQVWVSPTFLESENVRASGGTFPVRLWRDRGGILTVWREVRVGAHQTGAAHVPLDGAFFSVGDVLIVETNLALMVAEDGQGNTLTPLMSSIDNRNKDPYTQPGRPKAFRGSVQP